jgi:hypothetical protein
VFSGPVFDHIVIFWQKYLHKNVFSLLTALAKFDSAGSVVTWLPVGYSFVCSSHPVKLERRGV